MTESNANGVRISNRDCTKCGITLPRTADHFHRNKQRNDGLTSWCKSCALVNAKGWYQRNPVRGRANMKTYRVKLKAEMITAYGGACTCCGESEPAFLTLEHKLGGGGAHRKALGAYGVYTELRKMGWPQDAYTVLCFNCNLGSKGGVPCPHLLAPKAA